MFWNIDLAWRQWAKKKILAQAFVIQAPEVNISFRAAKLVCLRPSWCVLSSVHLCFFLNQNAESSDEEMLHIDTETKPEVKGSSLKAKKKDHSAAGILDLLQASKQVGGIDYSTNRWVPLHTFTPSCLFTFSSSRLARLRASLTARCSFRIFTFRCTDLQRVVCC